LQSSGTQGVVFGLLNVSVHLYDIIKYLRHF
jgi:hypothetical protein